MKRLPLANPNQSALGLPTIMDRDLAAAHGSTYVYLAVFAIDIDRVYWLDPEDTRLPFGWEVFLTEWYLLTWANAQAERGPEVLDAICTPLLEETPGEPPLGGQLVFAVYDAVTRGVLPEQLRTLFTSWRHAPHELLQNLEALHKNALASAKQLAAHCLAADLQPPLAAPTRHTLEQIQSGELQPPA
ncbi:MAG TPA: hypothetical protein VFN67_02050 [Polyangiales bacterium]|nr:hypothetical protein [Polyangiales bacterium]